jgi:hypothetical protein
MERPNREKMGIVISTKSFLKLRRAPAPILFLALASLTFSTSAQNQNAATADKNPSAAEAQQQQKNRETGAPDQIAPKNDRLFGVLPNYTTVERQDRYSPVSAKGKYKLWLDSTVDPYLFPFMGVIALIGQAENTEPSYGQGLKGYAKRYATSYADEAIGGFMTTATFPAVLHQDPRYYQLGEGSFTHRAFYAVSRSFITKSDTGRREFNVSEIAGNLVASGISQSYHPADERTFANTLSVWGTDIMWDTASNVAKEFWPDIRRAVTHKKKSDAPAAQD